MNKIREKLVQEFLNALKEDTIPWEKGWASTGIPQNAVSAASYHGLNAVILSMEAHKRGYTDARWCTYKQAKNQGWQVMRGEKGCQIEFWSMYDTEKKAKLKPQDVKRLQETLSREEYMERVKPLANYYTVFNAEQIQGVPKVTVVNDINDMQEAALIQRRDTLLENMNLDFVSGGDRAFYSPSMDRITMPEISQFKNVYAYMSTLLHEAGHATGHEDRLGRDIKNAFGTENYAREELRAEIASAFVSQSIGMENERQYVDNHRAYIQDWISVLEKNPEELFKAIKDAEQIADYLIEKGEFPKAELELVREESKHIEEGISKGMNNAIILQRGEASLTNGEYKKFDKGDTIWGVDSEPVELKRWNVEQEAEAKAELAKYKCTYSNSSGGNVWDIEEYALEYCECDEHGEFLQGSDYNLAEDKENRHQQIRADIRTNGFKASRTLVNAIDRLDAVTGRHNTLRDIKGLAENHDISADMKETVNEIVETLQQQETKMQSPEPPAMEPV